MELFYVIRKLHENARIFIINSIFQFVSLWKFFKLKVKYFIFVILNNYVKNSTI